MAIVIIFIKLQHSLLISYNLFINAKFVKFKQYIVVND